MQLLRTFMVFTGVMLIVLSWQVLSDDKLDVNTQVLTLMANNEREVAVTVYSPAGGCNACTLLFFSHGANIPPENYAALFNIWTSAGYVVATALHVDAETHPKRDDYSGADWVRTRVEDYELVTNALLRKNAGVKAVNFSGALIATGHSFGALIAQITNGATMHSSVGLALSENALRPMGVVAISPPGPIENYIASENWSHMRKPILVVTGTADSDPRFMPDWRLHKASYEAAPEGSAYLLVFDGIDHYFNGAFGRPTVNGFVSNTETQILNHSILAFVAALEISQPPSAAFWSQKATTGVRAASR